MNEENNSYLVWAERYELMVKIQGKTEYDPNGQKRLVMKGKLVKRSYVEARNAQKNNELYIIDEEKTTELLKERAKNIEAQAEAKKRENVSMADLVDAVVDSTAKSRQPDPVAAYPEGEPNEDWTQGQLKQYCKDNGIKFKGNPKASTLLKVIEASNEEE